MAGVTSAVPVSNGHTTAPTSAPAHDLTLDQRRLRWQIFNSRPILNALMTIFTLGRFWTDVLADRAKGLEGRIKLIQPLVSCEVDGFRVPLAGSELAGKGIDDLRNNQALQLLARRLKHDIGSDMEFDHALRATARVVDRCIKGRFIPLVYSGWQEVVEDFQKEIRVARVSAPESPATAPVNEAEPATAPVKAALVLSSSESIRDILLNEANVGRLRTVCDDVSQQMGTLVHKLSQECDWVFVEKGPEPRKTDIERREDYYLKDRWEEADEVLVSTQLSERDLRRSRVTMKDPNNQCMFDSTQHTDNLPASFRNAMRSEPFQAQGPDSRSGSSLSAMIQRFLVQTYQNGLNDKLSDTILGMTNDGALVEWDATQHEIQFHKGETVDEVTHTLRLTGKTRDLKKADQHSEIAKEGEEFVDPDACGIEWVVTQTLRFVPEVAQDAAAAAADARQAGHWEVVRTVSQFDIAALPQPTAVPANT